MAVVQYSGIINQIRGKLNGSVFNKARTIPTLQRKQQQSKGARGFQSEVRNFFSQFQRTWKTLSPSVKLLWQQTADNNPARDRFGNLVILSGYNQYIKASMLAEYANAPAIVTPSGAPAPANSITSQAVIFYGFDSNSAGNVIVEFNLEVELASYSADWGVIVDISLPISAGITQYYGRYTQVFGQVMLASYADDISANLGTRYPVPYPSQRVIIRVRVVHLPSGAVVQESLTTAIIS